MKKLSITQAYLLLSFNKKGKIPFTSEKVRVCIVAGGIIELLKEECIKFDEKNKLVVSNELSDELKYLSSMYERIKKHQPVKLKKIASEQVLALTNKKNNVLISDICEPLVQYSCLRKENGGISGNQSRYIPNEKDIDNVVRKIRAELLEDSEVTDETVVLVSLLDRSGLLKQYFSKYESKQLRERLKEIKRTSSYQMVKQMADFVDEIIAFIVVIT